MLSPLRGRKSDNYRYHDTWKSDCLRESNQEKGSSAVGGNIFLESTAVRAVLA